MTDEKHMASDLDDWLDDIDDSDEFSGELDQANIDALLNRGLDTKASGKSAVSPGQETAVAEDSVELDQANIDALLNSNFAEETAKQSMITPVQESSAAEESGELDQANIDALLNSSFDVADSAEDADSSIENREIELDQAHIDALLSSDFDSAHEEAEEDQSNGSVELDQANIDALLSDRTINKPGIDDSLDQDNIDALFDDLDELPAPKTMPAFTQSAGAQNSDSDLDDIDLLLADEDDDMDHETDSAEQNQDNIDALLNGAGNNGKPLSSTPYSTNATSGNKSFGREMDVDQDEIDQLFSGFDDEEIKEPFLSKGAGHTREFEDDEDLLGVVEPSPSDNHSSGERTVADDNDDMNQNKNTQDMKSGGFFPFLSSISKTIASILTLCLFLIIAAGVYFFHFKKDGEPAIPFENGKPVAPLAELQPPPEPEEVNHVPVVSDSLYTMPEGGGEVAINLTAKDDDGDTLTYEITSLPQYGRLSGDTPSLVYLPGKDFPGEDRFEYRAADAKESSALAKVIITGPNLAKLNEEKEKQRIAAAKIPLRPKKHQVYAANRAFDTISTEKFIINWERIWREANHTPFNSKVYVDIDASRLQGKLSKISEGKYVYQPNRHFTGNDVLRYRFKKGGMSSDRAKITMRVARGDLAPEIHIAEMADAYMVGETVRIDASLTRDENRNMLIFRWEQISGVPARLEKYNAEGSIVTFAMPSSFYTSSDPGPVLRVTASDTAGQSDSRVIKIRTLSKRKSALWGMADSNSSLEQGKRIGLR